MYLISPFLLSPKILTEKGKNPPIFPAVNSTAKDSERTRCVYKSRTVHNRAARSFSRVALLACCCCLRTSGFTSPPSPPSRSCLAGLLCFSLNGSGLLCLRMLCKLGSGYDSSYDSGNEVAVLALAMQRLQLEVFEERMRR
ncbi:hypothetical protein HN51_060292 [Arachis hypogaea]|nr:uncharacterized protein DS421_20g708800 [Arachis hypogaea]